MGSLGLEGSILTLWQGPQLDGKVLWGPSCPRKKSVGPAHPMGMMGRIIGRDGLVCLTEEKEKQPVPVCPFPSLLPPSVLDFLSN